MKLFLLRPKEGLTGDDNCWDPWYDKSFGMVVRAKTEIAARMIADSNAGAENGCKDKTSKNPWLDKKFSTCVELTAEGELEMIIQDFATA